MASQSIKYKVQDIAPAVDSVKAAFKKRDTISLEWRRSQLKAIKKCLLDNWDSFHAALKSDLNQIELIARFEHNILVTECDYMLEHLSEFTSPKSVELPAVHLPAWGSVVREPFGTVLIISPWNYPAQLSLLPTIGAIAGGNCVVLKPSELAPAMSSWIANVFTKYVDNEKVIVVEGSVDETTELLKQKFDLIFYTGNPVVGRIVAKAAAAHLTPTVLELGGKSPVVVDKGVNLKTVAKRVCFGKFTNCGQTCIAPDFLYIHKDIQDEFVSALKQTILDFYGPDPKSSKDYSRIIAPRHAARIEKMIQSTSKSSIVMGGQVDVEAKYVAPTIVVEPDANSELLKDEIFGPVLPIIPYEDVNQVIDTISSGEKPLALYLFTKNNQLVEKFTKFTSSGALVINETLSHGTCRNIPFGGVGNSGYGRYYGKYSFETFTHEKGMMHRTMLPDPSMKFPPYTPSSISIVSSLLNVKLPSKAQVIGAIAITSALAFVAVSWWNGTLNKHVESFQKYLP